jgi:hypothetical protein
MVYQNTAPQTIGHVLEKSRLAELPRADIYTQTEPIKAD